MLNFLENFDTDGISLNHSYCALVLMGLSIVRSGEYSEGKWNVGNRLVLEALGLHLMTSDDELESISAHECPCLLDTKVVRTLSCIIWCPTISDLILGITPQKIA